MSEDGMTTRRRRACYNCGERYTTYETVERTELRVVKKDGTTEKLEREKILTGLFKACEKRPVSMTVMDKAVDEIVTELHRDHDNEVPSTMIGQKLMDKLHSIDPVAYVRYVSVYREFKNVDEFIQEIQVLGKQASKESKPRHTFKS